MATNYALTHTTASATLAPRLTFGEEVVKFIQKKPLGAAGALIIVAMLFVAFFKAWRMTTARSRSPFAHAVRM